MSDRSPIPADLRRRVLVEAGHRCAIPTCRYIDVDVHHIIPLAKIRKNYQVDPTKDLIPLCANCHAMIHRRNPPLSIEELKEIIKSSHLP